MKKILIFASVLGLSGCLYAGEYDFLPQRNGFFYEWNSTSIDYFDNAKPLLVKVESVTEVAPDKGVIQRAYTGFSVFSVKSYKKSYYQDCFVKASANGHLSSASVPVKISEDDVKKLIGRSKVDGVWYSLLPGDMEGYVYLIKEDGSIFNKIGDISGGRLVMLDSTFIAQPQDIRFNIITKTKMEQTTPTTGFDIKYDGMDDNGLIFTILDYSKYAKNKGNFENLHFKYRENMNVNILGIKIKVLFADNEKLDYIILED